jgi:hypothetical protein
MSGQAWRGIIVLRYSSAGPSWHSLPMISLDIPPTLA